MSTEDLIRRLASGMRVVHIERRTDGSAWHVQVSLSPVHHPSGKWTELGSAISPTLDEALLAVVEAIQA